MQQSKNILLRIALVLLFALSISQMLNKAIFKSIGIYFPAIEKDNIILKKDTTNYNFLFLGSSKIQFFVDPKIIDSQLNTNSFNYGRNDCLIAEDKMLLQAYLQKHHPPKNLLLGLDLFMLEDGIGFYVNYLNNMDEKPIKEALKNAGIWVDFYECFPFLKTVLLDDYYRGIIFTTTVNKKEASFPMYKGYIPNGNNSLPKIKRRVEAAILMPVSPAAKKNLIDIIALCKSNNINLYMAYSPEYDSTEIRNVLNATEIFNFYDSVALAYNIPFLKHQSLPMCKNNNYFRDPGHVNINGANLYSNILANELKALGFAAY